ncbi:L-rhamnose mutarotase [Alicyclobacillus herbarius]|uniref:L-rhamnose mutarotase n=1 Tax=Alicyclobacillus herbarius TaxID=122960 RepID=UPI000403F2E5|nr:L-rhamnose mutarotase [Alicyclobacillus herbarius]
MIERRAFKLRIREGTQDEYVRRHKAVYEDLLQTFQDLGIKTYSIFMDGHTLYAYMEVADFDAVMKALDEDPANIRWQKYMADILIADADGKTMELLPEVLPFPEQRG